MIYKPDKDMELEKNLCYDYAFYVMFTSYFYKSIISSKNVESRLKLNFSEIKQSRQFDIEENVINIIDNILIKNKIFNDIDKKTVEVTFKFDEKNKSYIHILKFDDQIVHIRLKSEYIKEEKRENLKIYMKKIK